MLVSDRVKNRPESVSDPAQTRSETRVGDKSTQKAMPITVGSVQEHRQLRMQIYPLICGSSCKRTQYQLKNVAS